MINENAPVLAKSSIEIEAEIDTVWGIMANINDWPTWNPEIKSVLLFGEFSEGTKFQWKAKPGTITSTIKHIIQPYLLAWEGHMVGVNANHLWILEENVNKTIVKTEESWEGLIPSIVSGRMQNLLQKSIDTDLLFLKTEAEQNQSPESLYTSKEYCVNL
jgi:uncharacterized membrane protein